MQATKTARYIWLYIGPNVGDYAECCICGEPLPSLLDVLFIHDTLADVIETACLVCIGESN